MATSTTISCPEAILASIPWYPDGLTPEECGALEAHAADCRACRAELAFVRGDEEPEIELPDVERVYARVLARISANTDEETVQEPRISTARRVGAAARQASVAAGILVAVMSGMLTTGAIWVVRVAPAYETAAVSSGPDTGGPGLEVVFRKDASADQIRARLRDVGATVISGPTQFGVYRLRLAPGADVSAAIGRLRGEGRGVAAFAEPSRG
jgi:Fervidolysin N-terminal prodomain